MRIFIIVFSVLLAFGIVSDAFFPFLKEGVLILIIAYVFYKKTYRNLLVENFKESIPLFIILLYLFFVDVFQDNYAIDIERTVFNYKFLFSIITFVVFSVLFQSDESLREQSLFAFVLGAAFLSVFYGLGLLSSEASVISNDRLLLFGENPNSLSVRIALSMLFLIWFVVEKKLVKSVYIRVLLLLPLPFMFNLILASGSKGSFLLMILSVLLYLLFHKNIKTSIKIITSVILFMSSTFFLALFSQTSLYERFVSSESLTTGRYEIWTAALDIFSSNVFGVGELGYKKAIYNQLGREIDTHNLFIYFIVTGGLFCLGLFIVFLQRLFVKCYMDFKNNKQVINMIVFLSMLFVMSKTGGVLTYLIMWYFLAVVNLKDKKIEAL